jgi:hypothetical protein
MATIEQDGNGAFGCQKSEEKLQRDAVYSACDTVFLGSKIGRVDVEPW